MTKLDDQLLRVDETTIFGFGCAYCQEWIVRLGTGVWRLGVHDFKRCRIQCRKSPDRRHAPEGNL